MTPCRILLARMSTAEVNWVTFENAPFGERRFSNVWLLALATYGVGDVVTTIAMLYFVPALTEANPVVRFAIDTFGVGGFLALKLLVMYACLGIAIWAGLQARDRLMFYGPPVVLAVFGAFATLFNLHLLFSV